MTNSEIIVNLATIIAEQRLEISELKTEVTHLHHELIATMSEADTPQKELTAKCLNCHNAKACKENHWDGCIYEPQTEYDKYREKIRPYDPHKNWFEDEPQTDCGWGEPNE